MNSADGNGTSRSRRWLRFAPLLVVLAATGLILALGLHHELTLESLVERRAALRAYVDAHAVRAVLIYAGLYVAAVALSLPGAWWFTAMGGFLFGWLIGGALAALAATTGASLIFLAARTSFADVLIRRAGPALRSLADGFRRDSFSYLLTLRLIPLFPFWLVNLAPALVAVPLRVFAGATFIGILPGTFAFAVAGDGLDSIVERREAAVQACRATGRADCDLSLTLSDLVTPEIIAAIAALGLVSLLTLLLRRRLGARAEAPRP